MPAKKLQTNKTSTNLITELYEYIEQEEFDTDSIQLDVQINGNIAIAIKDKTISIHIKQFIQSHRSMFFRCIRCHYVYPLSCFNDFSYVTFV